MSTSPHGQDARVTVRRAPRHGLKTRATAKRLQPVQSASMKSYEVIRNAVDEPGVKAVAAALKVSPALVYKWCEPPAEADDPDQSGAKNPLDRVREMYMLTKDIRLIRWLCNQADGFFVANPVPELRRTLDETIFGETRGMVQIG